MTSSAIVVLGHCVVHELALDEPASRFVCAFWEESSDAGGAHRERVAASSQRDDRATVRLRATTVRHGFER